jgi:phenylacetate-CoA ligase
MSVAMQIYGRMPGWSRSVAASLRGFYLSRWRYDAQTEKIVEEILERDFWTARQWQEWRENRLAFILRRAAEKVPYYRASWATRRTKGDRSSPEILENWEILEKKTLRENAAAFVADDCDRRKMFHDHTSGTTGTSLDIWASEQTVKLWYAMFDARSRRWYGVSRRDRWAILGGQMITPQAQRRPPFWVWNAPMKQLYLSSYHLAPDLIGYYLDALCKYRIRYLLGYPSALYELARGALLLKRKDLRLDVVITNAEPVYDFQRETIQQAFACPVRETYGMAETVAAAGECQRGRLHQWLDAGIIEAENEKNSLRDFICTGLINPDMPLVRYRVGDSGVFSENLCECGRTLPLIEKIEGRTDDVLLTADGRSVGRLDPVFKNDLPILEVQIIQETLERIRVKFVPAIDYEASAGRELTARLKERMGDVEIVLESVIRIPRTDRGKFRAVVCQLPAQERARFGQYFYNPF